MTKEEKALYMRDYYKNNPEYVEKCKQKAKEWKNNNPEKVKLNREKELINRKLKYKTKKELNIPNGNLGKKQSQEQIDKRVEKLKCQKRTKEQIQKFKNTENSGRFTSEKLKNNTNGFKKGHIPKNFGISPSKETRLKLSISRIGKNTGNSNNNWRGGITKINEKIRKSPEYEIWRNKVFERDDYTCQFCNKKDEVSGKLNADHIKSFANFPELRFELSNGRTLCIDCHKTTDTYLTKSRWNKKI